jgi:hypothetical protein
MAEKTIEYYRAAAEAARNGHEMAMKYAEENKKLAAQYSDELTNLENLYRRIVIKYEESLGDQMMLRTFAISASLTCLVLFIALLVCLILLST